MNLDSKKTFLQQSSELYQKMIDITTNDVVRRYLAFRIIVNTMSYEDLIGNRQNPRMREIRDVLLAHKQESDFFEGYQAVDEITNTTISSLMSFMSMSASTCTADQHYLIPELTAGKSQTELLKILPLVFEQYEKDYLDGFRVINNFLCYTDNSVKEISGGELAGVFYRYNSSMALFMLAQYIHINTHNNPDLVWTARHAKLDMLLHAQNMADCAAKDNLNKYSIEGLLEVMITKPIGDPASLHALANDLSYRTLYSKVKKMRNKLIGHMDRNAALSDLLTDLDALPADDIHNLVHMVDKAVHIAARSHIAIKSRLALDNQVITNHSIHDTTGLMPRAYY